MNSTTVRRAETDSRAFRLLCGNKIIGVWQSIASSAPHIFCGTTSPTQVNMPVRMGAQKGVSIFLSIFYVKGGKGGSGKGQCGAVVHNRVVIDI